MISLVYLYILIMSLCNLGACNRILVVFPMRGISHGMLGSSCVELLLEAGHQVTYVSWLAAPLKPHQNLTVIDISFPHSIDVRYSIKRSMDGEVDLNDVHEFSWTMLDVQRKILENAKIQKLLNDPNEYFDLAILEWMYSEFIVGLPAVFDCPYIWLSSMEPHPLILNLIGEVTNPSYVPMNVFTYIAPFTFIQSVCSLKDLMTMYLYKKINIEPLEEIEFQRLVAPLITKRRSVVPSYNELRYNASLILGNSHISVGNSIALPEAYKSVGGYHLKKNTEPLPMDLKKLLDESQYGVIYFSMGSGLMSMDMPDEVIQQILKVFGGLKQTVLWKYETELLNKPSNVHLISWSPQQSILEHPNCLIFITHGGQLSSLEAVHYGVPVIGIPVFADQHRNVKTLARAGMAIEVNLSYKMGDDLKAAIEKVLGNSSYSEAAKHQSFIYHHRPIQPGIELVHWVEHVIRTKGAPHLRSISRLVPWYQKCYLDLILVISIVMILLIKTIKYILIKKSIAKRKDKNI